MVKKYIFIYLICCCFSGVCIEILPTYYQSLPITIKQQEVVKNLIVNSPQKTQVLVFFSFACHVCFLLEPEFEMWKNKVNQVVWVEKIPLGGNAAYDFLAKTYHIAKRIDLSGKLNNKIFEAIYLHKQALWQEEAMVNFLAPDILPDKFRNLYKSFVIDTEMKRDQQLAKAFQIVNTPNYIVLTRSGVFLTNLYLTREIKTLFATLDYLIQK